MSVERLGGWWWVDVVDKAPPGGVGTVPYDHRWITKEEKAWFDRVFGASPPNAGTQWQDPPRWGRMRVSLQELREILERQLAGPFASVVTDWYRDFAAKIYACLARLAVTVRGRALLRSIAEARHDTFIHASLSRSLRTSPALSQDVLDRLPLRVDWGRPKKDQPDSAFAVTAAPVHNAARVGGVPVQTVEPGDSHVFFDPRLHDESTSVLVQRDRRGDPADLELGPMPLFVLLGHELVHAWWHTNGHRSAGDLAKSATTRLKTLRDRGAFVEQLAIEGDKTAPEILAILAPGMRVSHSENGVRADHCLPPRGTHRGTTLALSTVPLSKERFGLAGLKRDPEVAPTAPVMGPCETWFPQSWPKG